MKILYMRSNFQYHLFPNPGPLLEVTIIICLVTIFPNLHLLPYTAGVESELIPTLTLFYPILCVIQS
jgi:hypothetical protein